MIGDLFPILATCDVAGRAINKGNFLKNIAGDWGEKLTHEEIWQHL